jgi:uncharacterized protein (DUF58 family)
MSEPLVDREFLEKLERLTLYCQKSFQGRVGGHNASKFGGPGQEFLEHRTYREGDDLRAVNWRAYMRLERLFLKLFQMEPRVPVRLLLDASASMRAGTSPGRPSKFDYARRLAAALVYVGLVRLDSMVIQPFGGGWTDSLVCGGGRHRFAPAEAFLRQLEAGGRTDFGALAVSYLNRYPQRGLTIVVSDFLDDNDCVAPLQYLADFGYELSLVQIWSDADRKPDSGQLRLTDAETGQQMTLVVDEAAQTAYTKRFDEYSERLRRVALRNGGRYASLLVDTPLEEALFGRLPIAATVG